MQINHHAHATPDSMKRSRILEYLTFIVLAASAVNAHASYSEVWLGPKDLAREEAQAAHGKVAFTCRSRAARCRPAKPSAQTVNRTAARDQSARNDPIAAFAANDRGSSRPEHH